nr:hypothetical protein HK105_000296 [Polyrhizophydium stewartii]
MVALAFAAVCIPKLYGSDRDAFLTDAIIDVFKQLLASDNVELRRATACCLESIADYWNWRSGTMAIIQFSYARLAAGAEPDGEVHASMVSIIMNKSGYYTVDSDNASHLPVFLTLTELVAVGCISLVGKLAENLRGLSASDPKLVESARGLVTLTSSAVVKAAIDCMAECSGGWRSAFPPAFAAAGALEALGAVNYAELESAAPSAFVVFTQVVSAGEADSLSAVRTKLFANLISFLKSPQDHVAKAGITVLDFVFKDGNPQVAIEILPELDFVGCVCSLVRNNTIPSIPHFMKLLRSILGDNTSLVVELDKCDIYSMLVDLSAKRSAHAGDVNAIGRLVLQFFAHHIRDADTSILSNPANRDIPLTGTAYDGKESTMRTIVEQRYMSFLGQILSKPSWWTKITDEAIKTKWRAEALAQGFSEPNFNLAIEELTFLADHCVRKALDGAVTVQPGPAELTTMSDDAVPEVVRKALVKLVGELENVPDHKKDWHPGTDQQVLDLVHPSLFCLVYGRSIVAGIKERSAATAMMPWEVLSSCERVAGVPVFDYNLSYTSQRFQWLPAEFRIQDDSSVSINSPINNLHPVQHRALYATISKIFERFVPLFEDLASVVDADLRRTVISNPIEGYERPDQYDSDDNEITDIPRPVHVPKLPEHFKPPEMLPRPFHLRGRNLQVIVKLANIHLTPGKPKYGGGSWHVEGTVNEAIIATGIYYYSMDNITTSRLSFREAVSDEIDYEQSDYNYWEDVYGISNETTPRNQSVGSLEAKQGRCIVFPNTFQHQVQPFELADPTRPGFRKILVFFLVNPAKRIVSTAHMAPQQPDWLELGLHDTPLPPELWRNVTRFMRGSMSLDEAKGLRLELMDERTAVQETANESIFEETFNLCEH